MVIITFPNRTDWFVANWVYRQFSADVIEASPGDEALAKEFELAGAYGLMRFNGKAPQHVIRLMTIIRDAAQRTVHGEIAGWRPDDPREHGMYVGAVQELLDLSKRALQTAESDLATMAQAEDSTITQISDGSAGGGRPDGGFRDTFLPPLMRIIKQAIEQIPADQRSRDQMIFLLEIEAVERDPRDANCRDSKLTRSVEARCRNTLIGGGDMCPVCAKPWQREG